MEQKNKKAKTFFGKRSFLYILWASALVAIMAAAVMIVLNITSSRTDSLNGNTDIVSSAPDGGSAIDNTPDSSAGGEEAPQETHEGEQGENGNEQAENPSVKDEDRPASGRISFIMPCSDATVLKGYTSDTLVFNSTLGAYMGHLAIDYKADAGENVLCVYDGVVESIATSYLTGTTVTVDHGNGLKSVYNSIEANEALFEGAKVSQGALIGTVAANNLQEYKDGAHLHFEVWKDGAKVNPEEYLIGEEK